MYKITIVLFITFFSLNSFGQINWQQKIKIASKLETKTQQVRALTKIYNSAPKDSLQVIGDVSYFLAFRYFNYFKLEKDSTLKYSQAGIDAYQKNSYRGYRLSRLIEFKGNVLFKNKKLFEAFEVYSAFDDLEMEDYRAVGSYLMAIVDQARIFRSQGDNEAGIQLLEYAENQPFFKIARSKARFRFFFEKSISYGIEASEQYNTNCDIALLEATSNITTANQRLKLNQQKGKIFINKKQYENAIEEFEKASTGRLNLKTSLDSILAAYAINNISHCQIEQDKPRQAIKTLNKYIPQLIDAGISKTLQLKLYDNLLFAQAKVGNTKEIDIIIEIVDRLILEDELAKEIAPIEITVYQFDKAEYLYNRFLSEGKLIFANKALEACWKMNEAAIQHENQILTQRAKFLYKKTIDTLYKLPIEIAGKLKNQEAFFYFTERSKNNLLLQDLGNDQYDLLPELNLLQEIRKSKGDNKELIDKLVEVRKEKLNYLFLKNERKHIETPSLSKFTEKLDGRYCLNYSFGSENLYLQTINSKGQPQIRNLGNSFSEDTFESFYKNVIDISGKDYLIKNNGFINHLNSIQIDTSSILILPDDYLFLFPFDILTTEKGPLYTLNHSYELNGSLFTNRKSVDGKLEIKQSVVVNPSYKSGIKDSSLQYNEVEIFELPYSFTEADGISKYLGQNGQRQIVKDKIKSSYQTADLFHFNGHAILDDNELFSYLPLDANGNNLYAYEFNNWNTDAKMVVLSACETGSGKIAAGEGVLSFSRSIIKSGAKSVVSTLWPVNDQSTATIISNFYSNLNSGESKANALSNAKQDYLSSCLDYQKHPYFWAGIIITGDNNPVIFASNSKTKWLWTALIFSFLLVSVIIFFRKRKKILPS